MEPARADVYPAGHLHHLSASQEKAFESFKSLLHASDVGSDRNDETMLRFLRASNWDPAVAVRRYEDTEEWRTTEEIDELYNTIDLAEYEETRLLYTQWTGRRDKRGIPLYVFDISGVDTHKVSASEKLSTPSAPHSKISQKLRRLCATYEHLIEFVMPLCSAVPNRPYPETPISQTTNIVDISNVSLRQFWNLKSHLQDASALATAHYPETLGRIFIIGAPSFFPTIWNIIKRWYDPITVSKIFILSSSEIASTLEEHIDKSDIPERYGGTLEWEFGQLPNLDPEIKKTMILEGQAETIPRGPIRWRKNEKGDMLEAHALGSVSGKQRDEVIGAVKLDSASSVEL